MKELFNVVYTNTVSKKLQNCAIWIYVIGIFIGIIGLIHFLNQTIGSNRSESDGIWNIGTLSLVAICFISSLLFFAVAEIIQKLHNIADNTKSK